MADRHGPDPARARTPKEGEGHHPATQARGPNGRAAVLGPGTPAPPFTLPATPDQKVSLDDFRDRTVVLAFYPADWSPVCGDELAVYNELLPEFHRLGAELLAVSVDGPWCHSALEAGLPCGPRRILFDSRSG